MIRRGPPEWAASAIWYQIFPERFRNGAPQSNPQPEDLQCEVTAGWTVTGWGHDWYRQVAWEEEHGVFYSSIFHRRYGGDLVGVREKLDDLQDLGVTALYVNPVFMAPSLHKYDGSCFHHIDPCLGPDRAGDLQKLNAANETHDPATWIWTAADLFFLDLVREVHSRGMRIILDGVFNHCGRSFFAFQDLIEQGPDSRYREWFKTWNWQEDGSFDYDGWAGVKSLPEFARTSERFHPEVEQYIFDSTARWLKPPVGNPEDAGIDGWRLDVAFCVPHGFWKAFRRHVLTLTPDAFLCGEIVDWADEYLRGDELDSVMNYMWTYPVLSWFIRGKHSIGRDQLVASMKALNEHYDRTTCCALQNLFDSHDLGRVLTAIANPDSKRSDWDSCFHSLRVQSNPEINTQKPGTSEKETLKRMAVFQMTFPGAPMIYYGTEVGMWGANDPDDRQPMLWPDVEYEEESFGPSGALDESIREPDIKLRHFFRKLIHVRKAHPVFSKGTLCWDESPPSDVLAFSRVFEDERILVLINNGNDEWAYRMMESGTDLWSGVEMKKGQTDLLPGGGWRIWQFSNAWKSPA